MKRYRAGTYNEGKTNPVFIIKESDRGTFHDGEKENICSCPSYRKALRLTGTINAMIVAARGL